MECSCDPKHALTDKAEFHFIDLSRIEEMKNITVNKSLIRWMKFFRSRTREEMKVLAEEDACIGLAFKTLEIMSLDENEVYQAWSREKFWMDQQIREEREQAERKREREEGEKKGREEGLIEAAKKLITSGMDTKTVCEMLGISESDLT